VSFFRIEGAQLSTTFAVGDVESFQNLLREVLDWRLAEYLSRRGPGDQNGDLFCRVARAGDHPILLLLGEATSLHIGQGLTPSR